MKNHIMFAGKLIQTNKKWDDLKGCQKEKIVQWLYETYSKVRMDVQSKNGNDIHEAVIAEVITRIQNEGIWLPESELRQYYNSKKNRFSSRYKKEHPDDSEEDRLDQ